MGDAHHIELIRDDSGKEWASAQDAAKWATASAGRLGVWNLMTFAERGLIATRAELAYVHQRAGPPKREDDYDLPPSFWKQDQQYFAADWDSGTFTNTVRQDTGVMISRKVEAYYVQFDGAGLLKWLPIALPQASASSVTIEASAVVAPQNKPGPQGKVEAWQDFYLAAMELQRQDELCKERFPTIEKLKRHLLDAIGDRLSEDSVRKPVAHIWRRFVDS